MPSNHTYRPLCSYTVTQEPWTADHIRRANVAIEGGQHRNDLVARFKARHEGDRLESAAIWLAEALADVANGAEQAPDSYGLTLDLVCEFPGAYDDPEDDVPLEVFAFVAQAVDGAEAEGQRARDFARYGARDWDRVPAGED